MGERIALRGIKRALSIEGSDNKSSRKASVFAAHASALALGAVIACLAPTQALAALEPGCNVDNVPEPTTTITSPASGTVLSPAPQSVNITVSIGASGTTQAVTYYANGAQIGRATASPWSITWANVPAGTYSLRAATTSYAAFCTGTGPLSAPVSLTVNTSPAVSVASPAPGTASTAPASFTFTANASDPDGAIANVQWFANGSAISGAISAAPYSFTWSGVAAGSRSITARATDNRGAVTTSAPITVVSNDRPTVTLNTSGVDTIAPGAITLQATAGDTYGGVSTVQYFRNGTALSGAITASPYTYSWTNVASGAYSIVARVTDTYGVTADSAPYNFVVGQPPTVSITAPAHNTVSTAPGSFTFTATAADADGSVANVQYFANGTAISAALTTSPYSFTWNSVASGTYSITARATDNAGAVTTSSAITVFSNDRPSVTLNTSNVDTQAPGGVTLQATAVDLIGGVSSVQYFRNGTALSTALTTAPYSYNWTNVAAGTYSIVARVTDAQGITTDSTPYSLVVNQGPTVSITAPATNSVAIAPGSFALTATASDSDGSIASVQYFSGATSISGALTAAPYSFTWSNVAVGSYTITARATDNRGGVTTSAPITLISNDRPTATVSVSNVNAVAPGSARLQATASDGFGGVSNVQYFANGTAVSGVLTTAPYTFDWTSIAANNYSVVARARDAHGTTGDSSAYSLGVGSNPLPAVALGGPADGALYAPGSSLTLAAIVTANGNTISKVEFFDGSTLIGQGTLSGGRYSRSWSPGNGSHSVTARVTDSVGRTASSAAAAISIVVPAVPTPPNLSGGISGTLAGTPGVSQSGAATYKVAIPVPPGTAGLAPTIELNYSSQAPASSLGLGWSMGGFSAITRCAKTVAQDGVRGAVNLAADDAYCLDGQRLVRVSGTHGANAEFRTEVDRFSKVVSYGSDPAKGPDRWVVTTKAGITMNYGATTDSNVAAQGTTIVLTWAVSSMVDPRGNTVTYRYTKDTTLGEFVPEQISYTSNPTTTPALAPYNAVRFSYETRPDPIQAYVMGSKLSNTKRLTAIRTYTNTAADGTAGSVVRQFLLSYTTDPRTGKSLIQSIRDCDAASTCLPATTFDWTQRTTADDTASGPGSGTWGGMPLSTAATRSASSLKGWVRSGDLNGDGRQDLLHSAGNGNWDVCLSTGTGFNCQVWTGATFPYNPVYPDEDFPSGHYELGDFNGDGRTDVAVMPAAINQNAAWTICYSTGASFNCQSIVFWSAGYSSAPDDIPSSYYTVADFDGDGRDDFLAKSFDRSTTPYTSIYKLCRSTGSGFACADHAGMHPIFSTVGDELHGDFNGDGRLDYLKRTGTRPNQTNNTWTVYLGGATGFTPGFSVLSASPTQDNYVIHDGPFFKSPNDLNGDPYGSYADILTAWIGNIELCRSTGRSFDCTVATGLNEYDSTLIEAHDVDADGKQDVLSRYNVNKTTTRSTLRLCQVGTGPTVSYGPCVDWTPAPAPGTGLEGDFNGDGIKDLAVRSSGIFTVYLSGGTRTMQLSRVTNGVGAATEFSYKSLSDDSVYTQDSGSNGATYPLRDVRDNTSVVSQMRADNGQGGWWTTDYRYGGMKTDLAGRGSLGFRWIEATDSISHVTTRTEFAQTFPHKGKTAKIIAKHSNGVELRRVESSFSQMATAGGAQFSYVSGETETTRDLNGAALATKTTTLPGTGAYDAYGNLLTQTVSIVGDGETFTTATTETYDNVPATWQIGRVRQTQVTKTAPGVSAITRTVTKDYDAYGHLLRESVEPNNVTLALVSEHTRDAFGNIRVTTQKWTDPVTSTAQQRDVITNVFDARGRWATTVSNALGQAETRAFDDGHGQMTSVTGPNQLATTTQYDGWGRKTRETRADGSVTRFDYRTCIDSCNGAVSVLIKQELFGSTPIASGSETFADRLGRPVQTRTWGYAGSAIVTQQRYESATGRLAQTSRPYFTGVNPVWTTIGYDDLGRKTTITEPSSSGATQQSTISYNGYTATLTNPKQQTKTKRRNALGLVKQITDALSYTTSYLYDPFGNLLRTTDALGNQINVSYDRLGRKTGLQDPDLGTWAYAVDPLGQAYRQTDSKQQVTSFSFDALGRMTRRLEPDQDSRWVYDSAIKGIGKLAEAYTLRGDGTRDYQRVHTYDSLSRASATAITLDQDYTTTLAYDPYGRLAKQTHARNPIGGSGGPANTIEYGYNAAGFLAQTRVATAAESRVVHRVVTQDAEARVTREALGNGLVTDRVYNPYVGTLTNLSTGADNGSGGDTGSVQSDTYQYDTVNNLTYRAQRTDDAGGMLQEFFDHDELNRVKSSQVSGLGPKSYTYDAIGNLKTRTGVGTYNYPASGAGSVRPHAVSSITGSVGGFSSPSFSYDGNGNTEGGVGRTSTWTTADLPLTVTRNNPVTGSTVTATFVYGAEHQRLKQTLSTGTTLVYAEEIEKETSGSGTKIKTYLPGNLGYVEESSGEPTPQIRYFHTDHLGSVIAVTDGLRNVLDRLSYDVWGQRRNLSGADDATYALRGVQDRTGYTGQETLDELALVHMNGRVYDPLVGRFTSADPTVPDPTDAQQFNRYSYVLNNPLRYVDPTGFTTDTPSPSQQSTPSFMPGAATIEVAKAVDAAKATAKKVEAFIKALTEIVAQGPSEGAEEGSARSGAVAASGKQGPEAGSLQAFAGELNSKEFLQEVGRKLLDDFVRNNQSDSPDSNPLYRWIASEIAGTYEAPDPTSANGVGATVAVGALGMTLGGGKVKATNEVSSVWRASKIDAAKMEHIFSADHVKNGIMELGKSKDAILNQARDALRSADKVGGLREGINTVITKMNGHDATVRAFIKNGEVQSMNLFKGISERAGQYVVDLR